jgi:hypothetical protein
MTPQLFDALGIHIRTLKATGSSPETCDMATNLGLDETYWTQGKAWILEKRGSNGLHKALTGAKVEITAADGTVTLTDTGMAANDEYLVLFTLDRATVTTS